MPKGDGAYSSGNTSNLLEAFVDGKPQAAPLVEVEEFDFEILEADGESKRKHKAMVPRDPDTLRELMRKRSSSRLEVMCGLARRVLS